MSQRDVHMTERATLVIPRGWVILGLGCAAWFAVVGGIALVSAAFQMVLATVA
jgi:hypothetical protein